MEIVLLSCSYPLKMDSNHLSVICFFWMVGHWIVVTTGYLPITVIGIMYFIVGFGIGTKNFLSVFLLSLITDGTFDYPGLWTSVSWFCRVKRTNNWSMKNGFEAHRQKRKHHVQEVPTFYKSSSNSYKLYMIHKTH